MKYAPKNLAKHLDDLLVYPKKALKQTTHLNYLPVWVRKGCETCGAPFAEVRAGYVCQEGCGRIFSRVFAQGGRAHLPKDQQIECRPINKVATAWRKGWLANG